MAQVTMAFKSATSAPRVSPRTSRPAARTVTCYAIQRPIQAGAASVAAALLLTMGAPEAQALQPLTPQVFAEVAESKFPIGSSGREAPSMDEGDPTVTAAADDPLMNPKSIAAGSQKRPEDANTGSRTPTYPNLAPTNIPVVGGSTEYQPYREKAPMRDNAKSQIEQADASRGGGLSVVQENVTRGLRGDVKPDAPEGLTLTNPLPQIGDAAKKIASPLLNAAKSESNAQPKAFEKDLYNTGR